MGGIMPEADVKQTLDALRRALERVHAKHLPGHALGLTCDMTVSIFEVQGFLEHVEMRLERGHLTPDLVVREALRLLENLESAQAGLENPVPASHSRGSISA
jgi:hypothetical protein